MINNKVIIKEIDYGIACRINDVIYINKNLHKYIPLYCEIINHELAHSPGFTFNDFLMDLHNKHLKGLKFQYYAFILTHPKALVEFLPCFWYNSKLVFNPTILVLYGITLVLIGGIGLILRI